MSLHTALVKIEEEKISSEKAKKFIVSEKNGAESIFIGKVRNENSGKKVTAVTYDAHDQAVIKSFQSICNNAKNKFDKNAKIFLEHAKGYAPVGEISILIAVGSGHRDEAFKICRYILEEVKHQSPIWKKEHYADGKEEWLPGHSLRSKKKYNNMKKGKAESAILIVLIAGIFWSFGSLVVRFIEDAQSVQWQYLFFRGFTIFVLINIYLFVKEGKSFIENYKKIGTSGILGGISLGIAMMCFIWSITHTTVAITLLMLAAMPFITAILGYIFLKEKVSNTTLTAIIVAAIGIVFMAFNSREIGTLFGLLVGLLSALGFSFFSVSLRWRKNTPTFTTVAVAGLFCGVFSFFVLIFSDANFFTTFRNSSLSALHGIIVCSGMILYTLGSKHLPAADLTLLSLTEILGGIFWVWLPIFGINEVPTANTIIGGSIITFALLYYSLNTKKNRRFIGLN